MKYISFAVKGLVLLLVTLLVTGRAKGQIIYQPYTYQFFQKLDNSIYSPASNVHTALKPLLFSDTSTMGRAYDSLMNANIDTTGHHSWLHRTLFTNHAVDVKNKDYTFYADFLGDVDAGREFIGHTDTYLNSRGYQVGGTIGSNFFFYTSGFENQGSFPDYEAAYIKLIGMVPGEAADRLGFLTYNDWSYVTALAGYSVSPNFNIVLGQDKTFIGDGYRSMLLSDFASAYPLFRVTFNIGKNIQYMAMWAYLEDQKAPQFNAYQNNRREWMAVHYIDWNITQRASIGFFNAIIDEEANNQGQLHGFDANYIDPLYFSSSLGPSGNVPDHTLAGFNAKYKVMNKTTLYGQILFDQGLDAVDHSSGTAWQLGVKGSDLFAAKNLNYLVEYNTAAPYTYSAQNAIVSYAEFSEPLADPLGANFKELVGLVNYSIWRFDLQGEADYARFGANIGTANYGQALYLPNNVNIPPGNGVTGQGLATTLKYAEGTIAYIINPKFNFRIEGSALLRQETNAQTDSKTVYLTIGIRTGFKDVFHDF